MEEGYSIHEEMTYPIAFPAKAGKYTMYFIKAIQQPDKAIFVWDIIIEVNGHCNKKHWRLIPK